MINPQSWCRRVALLTPIFAILHFTMPGQSTAQASAGLIDELRRDFSELVEMPIDELTPTYFVIEGRWPTKNGAKRLHFQRMEMVTTQRNEIPEPNAKDYVYISGRFEQLMFPMQCGNMYLAKPDHPCWKVDLITASQFDYTLSIRPNASLARVHQFVDRLKQAARANGATLSERKQIAGNVQVCDGKASYDSCHVTSINITTLCNFVGGKSEDSADSPFKYAAEGELWRMAGAQPGVDSDEAATEKIRRMWLNNRERLYCNTARMSGNVLWYAIRSNFPEFLEMLHWTYGADLNFVDPATKMTTLDFMAAEVRRWEANGLGSSEGGKAQRGLYDWFKKELGLKHASEL